MKYIRTKDGIYKTDSPIQPEKELQIKWIDKHSFVTSWKTKPCDWKQADTIEELCDEFVIYDKDQNNGLPITCPKERLNEVKPYIQIGMQKQFNCWLKGAI